MIEFVESTRVFGDRVAVDALDLVVPRGELFALLGPNGAGKTTAIKMLVGLLRPTRGNVRICGHDVVESPSECSRALGYVPDEPYLYDKLTGREFLKFISDMYGVGSKRARRRVEEEIERFQLGEFVDDLAESYSHGMKQRTVFASAVLHDPAVLVVDEPMVGLDPQSARLVKDLLRERVASGMTVFMSTHTLSVAEEIADRIGIFDYGRLALLGTLAQLRESTDMPGQSLEQVFLRFTGKPAAEQAKHISGPSAIPPPSPDGDSVEASASAPQDVS